MHSHLTERPIKTQNSLRVQNRCHRQIVNGFGFPRAWQVGSAHFLEDNLRGIMITLGDPSASSSLAASMQAPKKKLQSSGAFPFLEH